MCSNKHLATLVNPRSWSIFRASSCTFHPALATLITSLGPCLSGRIVGQREPKAQLGELDTNCNSSSFLKGIMKMAGVDMGLFNNHNKMDTQPDKTGETISLNPGGVGGAATWEPEQETSFGGRSIREKVLREHVEGLH